MGPSKKELPSCEWWEAVHEQFITNSPIDIKTSMLQPGKVSCEYCAGHSKTPWFLAKNLPHHLTCASHLKSAGEEQARQEANKRLDLLRTKDLERLERSEYQYAPLSHSRQLEVPAPMKPLPEIGEQEMWDDLELDRSGASLLDMNSAGQLNPSQQQEIEFYKALDRAEANFDSTGWGFEEFDVECDVDETLTNVMQDLGQLQKDFVPESSETHNLIRP